MVGVTAELFFVSAAGSVRELCGAYSTLTCKVVDPY